jgi:hypothetical protein
MSLIAVDKLTITFLVDNCIEWFTKLPPGFIHELPTHLRDHPPVNPLTGVPIIDFENYCCGMYGFQLSRIQFTFQLSGAIGFSALIVKHLPVLLQRSYELSDPARKPK